MRGNRIGKLSRSGMREAGGRAGRAGKGRSGGIAGNDKAGKTREGRRNEVNPGRQNIVMQIT